MERKPAAPTTLDDRVKDFLAQRRIAVAGVSRGGQAAANGIYQKLKGAGYQVVPVNPNTDSFEGEPCYPDLTSIPGGVDGVVIVTRPEVAEALVRQCTTAGIQRVWMHRSFDKAGSSVSPAAVAYCEQHGITVIAGGCPMMFCSPDIAHRCMRWILRRTGGLPA
ncbi:MAG: CoA-binding protein [Chloroflexales bacterium]|nr:CoA-binding protein [Chloroflexales bacterium]